MLGYIFKSESNQELTAMCHQHLEQLHQMALMSGIKNFCRKANFLKEEKGKLQKDQ